MNRSAYSVKDPVTGIIVASSPNDCLINVSHVFNHPQETIHDKENNDSDQRKADENPCWATFTERIPRSHQQSRSDNP